MYTQGTPRHTAARASSLSSPPSSAMLGSSLSSPPSSAMPSSSLTSGVGKFIKFIKLFKFI